MATFCKACRVSLDGKKGDRKKLLGDASGASSVYSILLQFLAEECTQYDCSKHHEYLIAEPAFTKAHELTKA